MARWLSVVALAGCRINFDPIADPGVDAGTDAAGTAPPPCDVTITADDTFAAFQGRLDSQPDVAPAGGDGVITLCLDNATIATSQPSEGGALTISRPVWIHGIGTATLDNRRTGLAGVADHGVVLLDGGTLSLTNLTLHAAGDGAFGVSTRCNTGAVLALAERVTVTLEGDGAIGFETCDARFQLLRDVTVAVAGAVSGQSHALRVSAFQDTPGVVELISGFAFTSTVTAGPVGGVIEIQQGQLDRLERGTITSRFHRGLNLFGGTLGTVLDVQLEADTSALRAAERAKIGKLSNTRFRCPGPFGACLELLGEGARIDAILDTEIQAGDGGLVLEGGSSIEQFERGRIVKLAATQPDARAIAVAGTAFFRSDQVTDVVVCSAGAPSWEDHTSDRRFGLLLDLDTLVAPTSHIAYPAATGAKTFPFTDLSLLGAQGIQGIQLGGGCP